MATWIPRVLLVLGVAGLVGCGGAHSHYAVHDEADPVMAPRAEPIVASRPIAEVASVQPVPVRHDELMADLAGPASDELPTWPTWGAYQHDHRFECVGPRGLIEEPMALRLDHGQATLHGWKLEWTPPAGRAADAPVVVGVLGATKDAYDGTLGNLDQFLAAFDRAAVDVIVVAGDLGYSAEDIAAVLDHLGASGRLVLALAGNADPIRGFHMAAQNIGQRRPNVVNGNLVRLVELGPASLVTLPGYHDPRFLPDDGGCQYHPDDVEALGALFGAAAARPVMVAHGPPRGSGPDAIDLAFDAGNVGDPDLQQALHTHGVRLGLFSHILEAGGRATDPVAGSPVKPGRWTTSMMLNAGAATRLAQDLHGGDHAMGMAAIVELGPKGARYQIVRADAKR